QADLRGVARRCRRYGPAHYDPFNAPYLIPVPESPRARPRAVLLPLPAPCHGPVGARPAQLRLPELQRHYSDWEITDAPDTRHVTARRPLPREPSGTILSTKHSSTSWFVATAGRLQLGIATRTLGTQPFRSKNERRLHRHCFRTHARGLVHGTRVHLQ